MVQATQDLEAAQNESTAREADTRKKTAQYEQLQADIDRRLMIITNSDTADDAVEQFENVMHSLQKIELADNYLQMLQDVEQMNSEARRQLQSQPDLAIATYSRLYTFVQHLHPLQQAAEGAAPHLVDYVGRTLSTLGFHIKGQFAKELSAVLEKILWPKRTAALPLSLLEPFNKVVNRLLALQKPELEHSIDLEVAGSDSPNILYPFQVLVEPLAKRFQYHFSGDRPTNRLDKPEYFFSHFLELLNTHVDFVSEYFQPLLLQQFHNSKAAVSIAYFDAPTAFISALLPMVRQRVFNILPAVLQQPQLFSHLISQLLQFDSTIQNDWRYDPSTVVNSSQSWRGLASEVLAVPSNFDHWLSVEHQFALSRYESIQSDSNAYKLDFDAVSSLANTSVPTTTALRIYDLLSSVIAIYRDLPSFSHRLRFLITIQIDILDRFHAYLSSAIEAYVTRTSSLGRTMQGVSAEELADLQGLGGLDRLARAYGSSEYLRRTMHDWSDDVFFLDMWAELQSRAHERSGDLVVKGPLHIAEIAERTSTALTDDARSTGEAEGALFEETAGNYAKLMDRAEAAITSTLTTSVRESLRPYAKTSFALDSLPDEAALTPSAELAATLQISSSCVQFLARSLAAAPLRRVVRALAKQIEEYVFERVVMMHDFTQAGAKQLEVDVRALLNTMEVGRKVGRIRLRRVEEAVKLLNLHGEEEKSEESKEVELTLWK